MLSALHTWGPSNKGSETGCLSASSQVVQLRRLGSQRHDKACRRGLSGKSCLWDSDVVYFYPPGGLAPKIKNVLTDV